MIFGIVSWCIQEVRKPQNQDLRTGWSGVQSPGKWNPIPETFLASGAWGQKQTTLAWKGQRYCVPQVVGQVGQLHVAGPGGLAASGPLCTVLHKLWSDGVLEMGHRRKERPDLPVCLVMVLPSLAARLRDVDEINSCLPLLLFLLF